MDIFTTQLTRVVPMPIRPASLKVKALLKEAANSKLNQDPDHIENHEYYFTKEEDQYHSSQQEKEQEQHEKEKEGDQRQVDKSGNEMTTAQEEEGGDVEKTNDGNKDNTKPNSKHLDLYA